MNENDKIDRKNDFSLDDANNEYVKNGGIEGLNKNKTNEMKKIIIVGIIFFIVGFLVSYIFGDGIKNIVSKDNTDPSAQTGETKVFNNKNEIEKTSLGKDTIIVDNQPFGDSIIISKLDLKETVWVTIYEDANGEPGNILGAGVFDAGSFEKQEISLLRSTSGDSTYYVKLLKDDGDRVFDHTKDLSVKNIATKKDLITTFKTTSGMPR
ncbi:MAG: hypothetical protein Athens071416_526 [Parcubacteria group bacterium Athens0714_16]|nr:MAG: hypothetical protein Athens071416_526 [Parcubacteria group bacterium Athens0714_16]